MFTTSNFWFISKTLFIINLFPLSLTKNLQEGDPCPFKDGSSGICKYLTECQSALDALENGDFPENSCAFDGTQSIFCCKTVRGDIPPSTTETTTSATTVRSTSTDTTVITSTSTSTTTTTQSTSTSMTVTSPDTPKPELITGPPSKRKPGDVSKQKCKEYAQYVYDTDESPVLILQPHFMHSFECAFEKLELIVGGTLASRQEFPHMALIGYQSREDILWDCGGSLISENYILSAGHCAASRQGGPAKYAKLGIANQTDTNHLQQYIISEVITFPEYTTRRKYHDIALFKLSESAELNTFVRPACLHTEKEIPLQRAIASGWGNIAFVGKGSNDLLKVVLEFFTPEKCNSTYSRQITSGRGYLKRGIDDETMLCAGSTKDIKNTCQGDSGGPLQIYHEDTPEIMCMYDIVGVTSFGKSCGLAKDVPGVYTRVSAYIKWIEDIVWPEWTYVEF